MNDFGLRFVLLFLASVALVSAGSLAATADDVAVFVKTHCIDCHGPDAQEGGLRLDTLSLDPARIAESANALRAIVRVHDRVRDGEMPPKDVTQPSIGERQKFLAALAPVIVDAERQAAGGTQRTAIRRMNRVEYEQTLRDLLGLPLLRVKDLLPEDGQQFGFDKVSGALDISHIQMTKYLQTADVALRQAVVSQTTAPETKTWREPAARQGTLAGRSPCTVPCRSGDTNWLRDSRRTSLAIRKATMATRTAQQHSQAKRIRSQCSPA